MMIHLGQEELASSHPRDIDALHAANRRAEHWMTAIYLEKIKHKHPRFTKKKLEEFIQFDKYLTPNQALDLGLIDHIGSIV